MENNKHDYVALRLSAYYNQEIKWGDKLHPAVEELKQFLRKNIKENDLEKFYDSIISTCKFFPRKVDLQDCLDRFLPESTIINRIGPDKQLNTLGDTGKRFAIENNVQYQSPEELKDTPMETMIEDDKKLSPHQMIKKYGVKKTQDLWFWMSDKGLLEGWLDDYLVNKKKSFQSYYETN